MILRFAQDQKPGFIKESFSSVCFNDIQTKLPPSMSITWSASHWRRPWSKDTDQLIAGAFWEERQQQRKESTPDRPKARLYLQFHSF